jgi:3-oxoacyl-[acyl-carrier protein] reductase
MKTVLITGASGGIGQAIAKEFAAQNFSLILTYNNSAQKCLALANELSKTCHVAAFKCDVANADDVKKLLNFVNDSFKKVDILVNNAGVSLIKLLTDHTQNEVETVLNTNLLGAINITKAFTQGMVSRKFGRIINITSIWGVTGASCETVYSASKAGLIGFTKALAKELGASNITVNAVAAGIIKTDMNNNLTQAEKQELVNSTPLNRLGTPNDVAKAVAFLASDDASFITGHILNVDGGFN